MDRALAKEISNDLSLMMLAASMAKTAMASLQATPQHFALQWKQLTTLTTQHVFKQTCDILHPCAAKPHNISKAKVGV